MLLVTGSAAAFRHRLFHETRQQVDPFHPFSPRPRVLPVAGVLLFFLFGMGENIFDLDLIFRRAVYPRLPPGGRPSPSATRTQRSVVIEELLDAAEAVAGGTGYESPPRLKNVIKRAFAAGIIQKYSRAHHSGVDKIK